MEGQLSIFDIMYPEFKIDKKIRLIELFAGIGSQAMALKVLGADFEPYLISEWNVYSAMAYKEIHNEMDRTDYSLGKTKEELCELIHEIGISSDGKTPLDLASIQKHTKKWLKDVYNAFQATHNLGSITNIHGSDLKIVEKDQYCYIMTYSFPCQDLSLAGAQKGMKKGSGTRSGLLWEVERLLTETDELPDVLIMENVPQVISDKNINDFYEWQKYLMSRGYTNYLQLMNASDYGIPQNRNRCFMVSLLGEYSYHFPDPIPLTKCISDYCEDNVAEEYYIKNDKANNLLEKLIEEGKLEPNRIILSEPVSNT